MSATMDALPAEAMRGETAPAILEAQEAARQTALRLAGELLLGLSEEAAHLARELSRHADGEAPYPFSLLAVEVMEFAAQRKWMLGTVQGGMQRLLGEDAWLAEQLLKREQERLASARDWFLERQMAIDPPDAPNPFPEDEHEETEDA